MNDYYYEAVEEEKQEIELRFGKYTYTLTDNALINHTHLAHLSKQLGISIGDLLERVNSLCIELDITPYPDVIGTDISKHIHNKTEKKEITYSFQIE